MRLIGLISQKNLVFYCYCYCYCYCDFLFVNITPSSHFTRHSIKVRYSLLWQTLVTILFLLLLLYFLSVISFPLAIHQSRQPSQTSSEVQSSQSLIDNLLLLRWQSFKCSHKLFFLGNLYPNLRVDYIFLSPNRLQQGVGCRDMMRYTMFEVYSNV